MADQNNPLIDEQLTTMNGHLTDIDTAIVQIKADLEAIVTAREE